MLNPCRDRTMVLKYRTIISSCASRFDCLRRRIFVASTKNQQLPQAMTTIDLTKEEKNGTMRLETGSTLGEGEDIRISPGILTFYDLSTGLFAIRYKDGNRQENARINEEEQSVGLTEGSTRVNVCTRRMKK